MMTQLDYSSCPCINTRPYKVPCYVGDSYFCYTGADAEISPVSMDDPLLNVRVMVGLAPAVALIVVYGFVSIYS